MTHPRVRLKFCGMTRKEDILCAAQLGADAIGLIFYPKSPRSVTIQQAKELLTNLPVLLNVVAVVVDPSVLFVEEIFNELPISLLQFHGNESPQFCNQFKKTYIKAIPANSAAAIYQSCVDYNQAAAILLDTPSADVYGGTGSVFDWNLIPQDLAKPFILAGGLNSDNVTAAVTKCSPYAIDVCSSIEIAPGIKNHEQMQQLVSALWGKQ